MKYFGMPLGMWLLFQKSFQKNMVVVLDFDKRTAAAMRRGLPAAVSVR